MTFTTCGQYTAKTNVHHFSRLPIFISDNLDPSFIHNPNFLYIILIIHYFKLLDWIIVTKIINKNYTIGTILIFPSKIIKYYKMISVKDYLFQGLISHNSQNRSWCMVRTETNIVSTGFRKCENNKIVKSIWGFGRYKRSWIQPTVWKTLVCVPW